MRWKKQAVNTKIDTETKQPIKEEIFTHVEGMCIYALLDAVQNKEGKQTRIITTIPGVCNDLFHREIERGNIHNGNIKMSKTM